MMDYSTPAPSVLIVNWVVLMVALHTHRRLAPDGSHSFALLLYLVQFFAANINQGFLLKRHSNCWRVIDWSSAGACYGIWLRTALQQQLPYSTIGLVTSLGLLLNIYQIEATTRSTLVFWVNCWHLHVAVALTLL